MSSILQLEVPVKVREIREEGPMLLVEWTSRWREFGTSIKPALKRSESRLAGEAPFGLIPFRVMIPSYFLEAFLILAAIFIDVKIAELRPYVAPRLSSHDVIYYTGDELPRTEDLGGAETGKSGRAGGGESHHRTQTIKIARGGSLTPRIVDAPNLKLPASRDAVANLLAVKPNPGPPPAEGLRSSRSTPNLATTVVAPAPNVIRDYTRNGVQLESVIAPAPNVTRDRTLTAPSFSAEMIPPAPSVPGEHKLVAPALTPAIVAPAPNVARDRGRTSPALASNVIPPAPGGVTREITTAPVQMMHESVVPPPVSAPERATSRSAKLTLPSPSVVAPPPSADISPDMRRLASGSVPDPGRTVVPPPPSQSGSGSVVSSLIGKIFGASEVVPPPPSVDTSRSNGAATTLSSNVVPPPPSVSQNSTDSNPHGVRTGLGATLGSNVVAPPPSVGANGGTGTRANAAAPYAGNPGVTPPPPSLSGVGGGSGKTGGGAGAPGGTLLANNIVPPPPSVGGGSSPSGPGTGRKGAGLGAPVDPGAGLASPTNGGSGSNAGAVISTQPGSKVGLPPSAGTGSLAMSPTGGDKPGIGGAGGGTGIGHGDGSGSAINGTGPGAAKVGTGHGSDPTASSGISPTPGPGGAGTLTAGNPPVRGVEISGGSSIVTLPGFGSDSAAADPSIPNRTSAKTPRQALGVTVVATASSGGAFEPYRNVLRGEKYTTYLDTTLGTAVLEFADEASAGHPFGGTLSAPSPIRIDLAEGLPRARMVLTFTLDTAGNVRNIRVLDPGPANMTAKVVAALRGWKFQPAMRGNQPVEVTAILGFGIDTSDRF